MDLFRNMHTGCEANRWRFPLTNIQHIYNAPYKIPDQLTFRLQPVWHTLLYDSRQSAFKRYTSIIIIRRQIHIHTVHPRLIIELES